MTEQIPAFMQALAYNSPDDRRWLKSLMMHEGVASINDLICTPGGGMNVAVGAGAAFVDGDDVANQGMYHGWNDASKNVTLTAPHASLNRIDLVVARILDSSVIGGALNVFLLDKVTGTAAASPVAPALPNSAIRLSQVGVTSLAGGGGTIVAGDITDMRHVAITAAGLPAYQSTNRPGTNVWNAQTILETDTWRMRSFDLAAFRWRLLGGDVPYIMMTSSSVSNIGTGSYTTLGSLALAELSSVDTWSQNGSGFTFPESGLWRINGMAAMASTSAFGTVKVAALIGAVRKILGEIATTSNGDAVEAVGSRFVRCTAGQTCALQVLQTTGAGLALAGNAILEAQWVRN